jgi:hypothetical protein
LSMTSRSLRSMRLVSNLGILMLPD